MKLLSTYILFKGKSRLYISSMGSIRLYLLACYFSLFKFLAHITKSSLRPCSIVSLVTIISKVDAAVMFFE